MPLVENKGLVQGECDGFIVEDRYITNLEIGPAVIWFLGEEALLLRFEEHKKLK